MSDLTRVVAIAKALLVKPTVGAGLAVKRVEAFEAALREQGYHVVPLSPDHPDKDRARRGLLPIPLPGHTLATTHRGFLNGCPDCGQS